MIDKARSPRPKMSPAGGGPKCDGAATEDDDDPRMATSDSIDLSESADFFRNGSAMPRGFDVMRSTNVEVEHLPLPASSSSIAETPAAISSLARSFSRGSSGEGRTFSRGGST